MGKNIKNGIEKKGKFDATQKKDFLNYIIGDGESKVTPCEIVSTFEDVIKYLSSKKDAKIYDDENPGCYITGFYYCKSEDKIYFTCGEE